MQGRQDFFLRAWRSRGLHSAFSGLFLVLPRCHGGAPRTVFCGVLVCCSVLATGGGTELGPDPPMPHAGGCRCGSATGMVASCCRPRGSVGREQLASKRGSIRARRRAPCLAAGAGPPLPELGWGERGIQPGMGDPVAHCLGVPVGRTILSPHPCPCPHPCPHLHPGYPHHGYHGGLVWGEGRYRAAHLHLAAQPSRQSP